MDTILQNGKTYSRILQWHILMQQILGLYTVNISCNVNNQLLVQTVSLNCILDNCIYWLIAQNFKIHQPIPAIQ